MPALAGDVPAGPGPEDDPWIGHRLDDRYTLEQRIGEGGTGRVYRARHDATGRSVAIKLLRESLLHDEASVKRFEREARASCRINHPNAITVHDFGRTREGQCYLVTELIEGETLRASLDREGLLPAERALSLFSEIVSGVKAAHDKGVVHRDLHPGNLFLCRDEALAGREHVKIFDFGGARLLDSTIDTDVTGVGQLDLRQLLGSIRYLPPERLQRGWRPDPRGDVYALGLILFELCTGQHPFPEEDPLQVMAAHLHEPPPLLAAPERRFSLALQGLVSSMLAKDPQLRPADATEVLQRLRAAAERDSLISIRQAVPEPDVEMEMVALPADETDAVGPPPALPPSARRAVVEPAPAAPPALLSLAASGPTPMEPMGAIPRRIPAERSESTALVKVARVAGPHAAADAEHPHAAHPLAHALLALFCLLLGAALVFAAGTFGYRYYQRQQQGIDAEPDPAPLRP